MSRILRIGDQGPDVRAVQDVLRVKGSDPFNLNSTPLILSLIAWYLDEIRYQILMRICRC